MKKKGLRYILIISFLIQIFFIFIASSAESTLVSFDFKDADIRDVIRAIATQTNKNIIAERDVQGRVTVHLRNVPFDEALKLLLEANGFTYEKRGDIYYVKRIIERPVREGIKAQVKVIDGKLSLDVRNMEIRELLSLISKEAGINIVTDKAVTGIITLSLRDVPLKTGLNAFLSAHGFTLTESEGIYHVGLMERVAPMLISITEGLLSIDVKDAELSEVLRRILKLAQKNLVIFGQLRERVDLFFSKVPLDEGLNLILQGTRHTFRREGDTYMVGDPALTLPGAPILTQERVIKLRYIPVKTLPHLLPPSISIANIKVIEDQNAIFVKGTDAFIKEVEEFIEKIDQRPEGVIFKDGLLSVELKNISLSKAIERIIDSTGANIIVLGPLHGEVTISFKDLSLEEGLRLILEGTRFASKRIGDTYFIGDPSLTLPSAAILTEERLIKLKHVKAKEIPPLLPPTIPTANIKVIEDQNAILIKGTSSLIDQVERVIFKLDQRPAQIMIEALVVEFTRKKGEEFGLEGRYSKDRREIGIKPGLLTYKTVDKLPEDFSIILSALISEGKAKVRANPRIAALHGEEAIIKVGWVRYFKITQFTGTPPIPYTTLQTVDAGITLKLTPWVNAADEIIIVLSPEISDATGIGPEGLPEISRRSINTTIRVKDGETIIIGGLIQTNESETIQRIPIISRIPILGRLFQRKKKELTESELVIYLTPRILRGSDK